MMHQDPRIEFVWLTAMVGRNPDTVAEMLEEFAGSASRDAAALRAARTARNADDIQYFAQRIKGASKLIGAVVCGEIAEALEEKAMREDILCDDPGVEHLLTAIDATLGFIREANIESELKGLD